MYNSVVQAKQNNAKDNYVRHKTYARKIFCFQNLDLYIIKLGPRLCTTYQCTTFK